MGERDITERSLENHNDVFADIVNVFFAINGIPNRPVKPEDLRDAEPWTSYGASGALREQERDKAKLWLSPAGETVICLIGLENQTAIDTYMALRVMGYEGADYRGQIPPRREKGKRGRVKRPHFVITIVLYFGTARRWPRRRSLQERLRVPAEYRPLVAECPVNVLELAWLTEEQEAPFKGEFRHLVHYLRQARMGQKLDFLQEPAVKHLAEFFAALRALTRDEHYDALIEQACEHWIGGEPGMKLPSLFDAAREEGIALGRSEGRESTCQMIRERLTAMGISQEIIAAATNLPPAAMEGARA